MKKTIRFVLNTFSRPVIQRFAHFIVPIMGFFYVGKKVTCPICGHHYRKFMPYGYATQRENALCPHCLSLERHRLMWLYLKRETNFFEHAPLLLHVAPERCFIKRFEKVLGTNYVTADLESPLAKVKMDVQAIPFPDNEFDTIFCNHILEHVTDDRIAMRELYRVMKTGGWGIMLSPVNPRREHTLEDSSITTPQERMAAYGQYDHMRDYGLDYAERLSEAGFDVQSIDYASSFSPAEQKLYGIRGETIYLVRKL